MNSCIGIFLLPGILGIIVGVVILMVVFVVVWLQTIPGAYTFEPSERGFFERMLATYLDIAKFIIGLASGGIVLIIGSSALSSSTKKLPVGYANPLFVLAMSVVYGILFMPIISLDYEGFRHGTIQYTRWRYCRNRTLGFSALACFCVGYAWLVFAAVRA
jgi:hypothetical protein